MPCVLLCTQGRPSPWGHDAFPLFQISPYFPKIFRLCGKFSKLYLFRKIFSIFIRQNFWLPFFSHPPQISNFPLFSCFSILPCFAKIIISSLLLKMSLLFSKNSPAFYILYMYFVFPLLWLWCIYASPNARTGRPCVHIIFINFDNHSPDLGRETCLAPEGFERSFSGPWLKKVVHHCSRHSRHRHLCRFYRSLN